VLSFFDSVYNLKASILFRVTAGSLNLEIGGEATAHGNSIFFTKQFSTFSYTWTKEDFYGTKINFSLIFILIPVEPLKRFSF
jgi:hypothetical protein